MTQFDAQVSLAIGERDAVQLEARTQVEDFEEKLKAMQEQLQKVIDFAVIMIINHHTDNGDCRDQNDDHLNHSDDGQSFNET